ncbi:MAG: HDIG domain-containing metalloprotein [Desulforhopalus sp.]
MAKNIPSINQCLELHDRFQMYDNIRAHSFMVARVAEALVDDLYRTGKSAGPLPDKEEVIAGALLHDIAKTLCIKTHCHHAEVGRQICLELGYPKLSEVVAEHVVLKCFAQDQYVKGIFGTKEMVYYSDKRVRHDQVVSLAGRLEYILKRYGDNNPVKEQLIQKNFSKSLELEKYLFGFLDFHPDELIQHISHNQFTPTPQ